MIYMRVILDGCISLGKTERVGKQELRNKIDWRSDE